MRILDKKNMIKIDAEDLNDAKLSSMDFVDENIKKRAFTDVLGARLGMKFLFSKKIEANNLYSLYSIHKVLQRLDIADVYFENVKIDVRLVFNHEEIFVPKKQSELDILPDVYLVLALQEDMSGAECIGFFEPKNLDEKKSNKDFYFIDSENLQNPDELKNFLTNFRAKPQLTSTQEELQKAENFIWPMVDDEISNEDSVFLLTQLATNFSLREKFVELENFELMSKKAGKDNVLMKDRVLDFVGAQEVHENPDFDENTIEEINFEPLPELEELEDLTPTEPENNSGSDIAKTLVQGAAIAGGVALAGGAIAASSAAMAQGIAAASAQGVTEGLVSAGTTVLEGVADTLKNAVESPSFEELTQAEKAQENVFEFDSIEELAPLEELPELEELSDAKTDEVEDIEAPVQIEEKTDDVVDLADFDFDMFDEGESAQEVSITEEPTIEEPVAEDFVIEEPPVEEAIITEEPQEDAVIEEPQAITELEPLEELPQLEALEDTQTEEPENAIEEFEATAQDTAQEEEKDEYAFSFDDISDAHHAEENPLIAPIVETDEFIEADDTEIENQFNSDKNDDDMGELTSEVDELLRGSEFTGDQNFDLTGEFADIESFIQPSMEESMPQLSLSQLSTPETIYDNYSAPEASNTEFQLEPESENQALDQDDSDLLKVLFKSEDVQSEEISMGPVSTGTKPANKKRTMLAASVAGVILIALIGYGVTVKGKTQNVEFPKDLKGTEAVAPTMPTDGTGMPAPTASATTPSPGGELNLDLADQAPQSAATQQDVQPQAGRDMGQAVSEAFMSDPVSASVSKVAWEVPEEYAYNDSFRKYLQTAGKNLKLTLQNDLLLSTEMAYSDKIVVDLDISKDGTVKSANIVTSSGSKQIDKIVLQSVKETLKYLKVPAGEVSGQSVSATLIINF